MNEAEALARLKDLNRFPSQHHNLAQAFAKLADLIQREPQGRAHELALVRLAEAYDAAANMVAQPAPTPAQPRRAPAPARR